MQSRNNYTRRQFLGDIPAGIVGLTLCRPSFASALGETDYPNRLDVRLWAQTVSEQHGIDVAWILTVLAKARHVKTSKRIMERTASEKNWTSYRARTITEERIRKGVRFMRKNAQWLNEAQSRWGVPAEIITAVIGIETIYGKSAGRYRVLDVLATLSFDHERRAEYFQSELAAFLVLCSKTNINPTAVQGSFAGAIGLPQFMPSNILRFGTDFDGNGIADIRFSAADAIGSTANYLKHLGWNSELPTEWPCRCTQYHAKDLDAGGIVANTTLQNLLDAGVEPLEPIHASPSTQVLLVDLPGKTTEGKRSTLWFIGTENFSALLRYNRSYFYAQSVCDLSSAIKTADLADDPMLFF